MESNTDSILSTDNEDSSFNSEPNININEDLNSFSIIHNSSGNTFKEEWERVWPVNIKKYNLNIENNDKY